MSWDDADQLTRLLLDNIPETKWNGMYVRYIIDWSRNVRFKGYRKWILVSRGILQKMRINEAQLLLDPAPSPEKDSGENVLVRKLSWSSLLLKDSSWTKLENLTKSSFYLLPLFRTRFYLIPLTGNENADRTILEILRDAAKAAPEGIDFLTDKIFFFSDGKLKGVFNV